MQTLVTAYFFGEPDGTMDRACRVIFETIPGVEFAGSGTMLEGIAAGERDVEYLVPDDQVESCRETLRRAGFRLEPSAMGETA